MSSIKYQYGFDPTGQTINIKDLHQSKEVRKEVFRCLGCNNLLVAVLGEKRQKHFRHKADIQVNCSPETYLHKLGKMRFYEEYKNCIQQNKPFYIEFKRQQTCNHYQSEFSQTCQYKEESVKFDLTQYFKKIFLEKKEGSFIPDLLLVNDQELKLFIEIAVTHQLTEKKAWSKYRIIELRIQNEDDLESIDKQYLIESEKNLFLNFKKELIGNFCGGNCIEKIEPYANCLLIYIFFVVFQNGKSAIFTENLTNFQSKLKTNLITYYQVIALVDPNRNLSKSMLNEIFVEQVMKAYSKKIPIKNCYLCHHHGDNYYGFPPIYCKSLKKRCKSNEAVSCKDYTTDSPVFQPDTNSEVSQPRNKHKNKSLETSSITPSIILPTNPKFREGKKLTHPTFGNGVIIKIVVTDVAEVEFPSSIGIKYIYLPNCTPLLEE
ncbi:MAG TPA: competence protein CoiA family protein [Candidatus Obscuribacterales bacterium]